MTGPLGIYVLREAAMPLASGLAQRLSGEVVQPAAPEGTAREQLRRCFFEYHQWLLVMATGVAVRFIGDLPRDKRADPGVVVLDEAGRFAIPLLGGHEGGANALAYRVAAAVGAVPVITTASEAKRPLTLGIGCRKGSSAEAIEAAAGHVLGTQGFDAIREVATVDIKAEEPGLLRFCERHELPLRVIEQRELRPRSWTSRPSEWVHEVLGVWGVCEPCALWASPRGRLLREKTCLNGVAVALVEDAEELA